MNMLLAFAPFLAFAVLSRSLGAHNALVVATLLCAALIVRDRWYHKHSLKLLEVGSLVLFGVLALLTRFEQFNLSVIQVRLIVDLGLLTIVLTSLVVGRPFTLQYAREQVSPEVAATDRFRKVSLQLSLAWTLAFVVIVVADVAMLYLPVVTPLAGTIVIVAVIGGAAWFTQWWPARRQRHPVIENVREEV